jgi:hypothetical protein
VSSPDFQRCPVSEAGWSTSRMSPDLALEGASERASETAHTLERETQREGQLFCLTPHARRRHHHPLTKSFANLSTLVLPRPRLLRPLPCRNFGLDCELSVEDATARVWEYSRCYHENAAGGERGRPRRPARCSASKVLVEDGRWERSAAGLILGHVGRISSLWHPAQVLHVLPLLFVFVCSCGLLG